MNRRALLTATLASLSLGGVMALPALAETKTKTFPVGDLFPFLKNYLEIPTAERTHFTMAYIALVRKAKPDDYSLTMSYKGVQTPIKIASNNQLTPLPSLEQIKNKAMVTMNAPKESSMGLGLSLVPTIALAQALDAKPLNLAITQAAKGSKKVSGILAMAVPKFDRIIVWGVSSGNVILANGESKPLPAQPASNDKKGHQNAQHVTYVPADWPNAKSLSFNSLPDRLEIDAQS